VNQEEEFPNVAPLSHSDDDPETSHAAEEELTSSGRRDSHKREVLALVKDFPGRTAKELYECQENLQFMSLQKRLSDLKTDRVIYMGIPRPCEVTGRKAAVWYSVLKQKSLWEF